MPRSFFGWKNVQYSLPPRSSVSSTCMYCPRRWRMSRTVVLSTRASTVAYSPTCSSAMSVSAPRATYRRG